MALYTKCIFAPREAEDGLRVSVMSRHTLEDGKTPDPRITELDLHLPELGPSPRLIGKYCRSEISWGDFAERYLREMRADLPRMRIAQLALAACVSDLTILCVEEWGLPCHRVLLADLCQKTQCHLRIIHR